MRRRSKRWQRDSTVTGTLRISVVANTNFTCGGGSSSVFSNALNALRDSMWTSSMMKTFVRACIGRNRVASMISRTSSTPVRLAASISTTSGWRSARMARQLSHTPQGSAVGPPLPSGPMQLSARAMMRAVVVLPTPRTPGQHEGVRDPVQRERTAQDANHRVLPDQIIERRRPVFARENPVGHGTCISRSRHARIDRGRFGGGASPNNPGPSGMGAGRSSWSRTSGHRRPVDPQISRLRFQARAALRGACCQSRALGGRPNKRPVR